MAKIKQKITISESESDNIRKVWDAYTQEWNYSIADIIAVLTETTDARNYWKALKNRLKNSNNKLVSNCNQLKMPSSDGKFYISDAGNRSTIIGIVGLISPNNVDVFESWFDHIEVKKVTSKDPISANSYSLPLAPRPVIDFDEEKISTAQNISVDVFEEKDNINIILFTPGVKPNDISISVTANFLTINYTGVNEIYNKNPNGKIKQEISFGRFYRKIKLPNLANIDSIEATEFHGMLKIKIDKIDKNRERFIKIKSLN